MLTITIRKPISFPSKKIILSFILLSWLFSPFLCMAKASKTYANFDDIDNNLSAMIGQMLVLGINGTDINHDPEMANALKNGRVGGVILFYTNGIHTPYNISSPAQIKNFITQIKNASKYPPIISVDQEGGKVQRLLPQNGFKQWKSAEQLGKADTNITYNQANAMAKELAHAGFNVNYAPVVDLLDKKSPAIGAKERAFHKNPYVVTAHAEAYVKAMKENHIVSSLKHFPGHGFAKKDSHLGLTDITKTWVEDELIPYQTFIDQGYDGMVMIAHVYHQGLGTKPASLSYNIITKLLREKMGFNGVVVTDDMQMGAIIKQYTMKESLYYAINAGVDILLFGNNLKFDPLLYEKAHTYIMELVAENKISKERITQSWQRIRKLKEEYILINE